MTILVQAMEHRYSAQLIIAALNEAPGIGLTIAEMKDTLGEVSVLVVDGRLEVRLRAGADPHEKVNRRGLRGRDRRRDDAQPVRQR